MNPNNKGGSFEPERKIMGGLLNTVWLHIRVLHCNLENHEYFCKSHINQTKLLLMADVIINCLMTESHVQVDVDWDILTAYCTTNHMLGFIWQGKSFTSIEPSTDINDLCLYPDSGKKMFDLCKFYLVLSAPLRNEGTSSHIAVGFVSSWGLFSGCGQPLPTQYSP